MKNLIRTIVIALALLAPAVPLAAQEPAEPLERFVVQVARYWAAGDVGALVDLAPSDGRIVLDLGESLGPVQARHAAAALRALFSERETSGIRLTGVTIAGGKPLRGFGELAWTSRSRGMSDPRASVLYVGTIWEGNNWRIRELRILR